MDPRTLDASADDLERRASDNRDESDRLLREAETFESEASSTRAEASRLRAEQERALAQERAIEADLPRTRPWPF